MKKYLLSLMVLVVAVAAMAFTNVAVPAEEVAYVEYQFGGSSMDNVYNTNAWTQVTSSTQACIAGENLPCIVRVESGTLSAWLNAREHEEILDDARTLKQ